MGTAEKLAIIIGLCVSCCVVGIFASKPQQSSPTSPSPAPSSSSSPAYTTSTETSCRSEDRAAINRRLDEACEEGRRGRVCPAWRNLITGTTLTCYTGGAIAVRVSSRIQARNAVTEALAREGCSQVNAAAIGISSQGAVVRYYMADGQNIIANNVFNAGGYCTNGLL